MNSKIVNEKRGIWSATDQKPIIAWLTEHGIEAKYIPINASFTLDGGTCTTQQYRRDTDGHIVRVGNGPGVDPLVFDVHDPFPFPPPAVTPPSEGTQK